MGTRVKTTLWLMSLTRYVPDLSFNVVLKGEASQTSEAKFPHTYRMKIRNTQITRQFS